MDAPIDSLSHDELRKHISKLRAASASSQTIKANLTKKKPKASDKAKEKQEALITELKGLIK